MEPQTPPAPLLAARATQPNSAQRVAVGAPQRLQQNRPHYSLPAVPSFAAALPGENATVALPGWEAHCGAPAAAAAPAGAPKSVQSLTLRLASMRRKSSGAVRWAPLNPAPARTERERAWVPPVARPVLQAGLQAPASFHRPARFACRAGPALHCLPHTPLPQTPPNHPPACCAAALCSLIMMGELKVISRSVPYCGSRMLHKMTCAGRVNTFPCQGATMVRDPPCHAGPAGRGPVADAQHSSTAQRGAARCPTWILFSACAPCRPLATACNGVHNPLGQPSGGRGAALRPDPPASKACTACPVPTGACPGPAKNNAGLARALTLALAEKKQHAHLLPHHQGLEALPWHPGHVARPCSSTARQRVGRPTR